MLLNCAAPRIARLHYTLNSKQTTKKKNILNILTMIWKHVSTKDAHSLLKYEKVTTEK